MRSKAKKMLMNQILLQLSLFICICDAVGGHCSLFATPSHDNTHNSVEKVTYFFVLCPRNFLPQKKRKKKKTMHTNEAHHQEAMAADERVNNDVKHKESGWCDINSSGHTEKYDVCRILFEMCDVRGMQA